MNLHISPVEPSQWQTLQELSVRTFRDAFAHLNKPENMESYIDAAFNDTRLKRDLADPATKFLWCKHESETIGFMKINFSAAQTDLHDAESLEIERIYILKDFQSLKAGAFLLGHATDLARLHSLKYVWLGVWEHNVRAINFYSKNGFSVIGQHSFMLGDDPQIDLIMKKEL